MVDWLLVDWLRAPTAYSLLDLNFRYVRDVDWVVLLFCKLVVVAGCSLVDRLATLIDDDLYVERIARKEFLCHKIHKVLHLVIVAQDEGCLGDHANWDLLMRRKELIFHLYGEGLAYRKKSFFF